MRKGKENPPIDPIDEPGVSSLLPWLLVGCGVFFVVLIVFAISVWLPTEPRGRGQSAQDEESTGIGSVTEPVSAPGATARGIDDGFVSEQSCAECHSAEYDLWAGSHHDEAMKLADESTVRGNFSDTRFDYYGMESRFYKRDGKFFVHTEGPGGAMGEYEIAYTFGVEPLQQYLIALPGDGCRV